MQQRSGRRLLPYNSSYPQCPDTCLHCRPFGIQPHWLIHSIRVESRYTLPAPPFLGRCLARRVSEMENQLKEHGCQGLRLCILSAPPQAGSIRARKRRILRPRGCQRNVPARRQCSPIVRWMTDRCLTDRAPGPRNPSWGRGNRSRPPNRMSHLSSTGRSRENKVSVLRFHSHPCNVLSRWPSTPERLIPADDIPQNMQSVSLSLYQRRGDLGQPTGIHPIHSQVHNCQHHTRFVK